MKKLLIVLLFPFALWAQNEKKQTLELPDFIITGTRGVDIPVLQKKKPKLLPVLANDFYMPVFSPEDFVPAVLEVPFNKDIKLFEPNPYYTGKIELELGNYTFPSGEFNFLKEQSDIIFNFNIGGRNQNAFLPYSDFNSTHISANGDYYVKSGADFFNNAKLSLSGGYSKNMFRMYASNTPSLQRGIDIYSEKFYFGNESFRNFNYSLSFEGKHTYLSEDGTKDIDLTGFGVVEYKSNSFNLEVKSDYKYQLTGNDTLNNTSNYLWETSALLKLKPAYGVQVGAGVYSALYNGEQFLMPKANLSFQLNDYFSLLAEYAPSINLVTLSDLLTVNRYSQIFLSYYRKNKTDMKISLCYENDKYVEITTGVGFASGNFGYFLDNVKNGYYNFYTADVTKIYAFMNLNFHPGPFGYFYGNIMYQNVQNDAKQILPYEPAFKINFVYGYDFDFGLLFKTGCDIQTSKYTDLSNSDSLPAFVNLSASLGFRILNNMVIKVGFENITNNLNYTFRGYREKPFEIVAGVEYRW